MSTPSEELASRIIKRLTAEKLIEPGDSAVNAAKLASGKVSAQDWRLALESSLLRGRKA
jgi:hypothetical protein